MSGDALPEEERRLLDKLRAGLAQKDAPQLGSPLLTELADSVDDYGRDKEEHFLRRSVALAGRRLSSLCQAAPLRTPAPRCSLA
jgi:hypothetical protein